MSADAAVERDVDLGGKFFIFDIQDIFDRDSRQDREFKRGLALSGILSIEMQTGQEKALGVSAEFFFQGFPEQGMGTAEKKFSPGKFPFADLPVV